jgi:serine/threonine-protein kinase
MESKIGRFEILSELSRSERGCVYKATDSESGQTVALKTVKLEDLGDQAATFVQRVQAEAEAAKALNSPNIAVVYGTGDFDGHFCASLEYIQGNSVYTTLSRQEGFSIWDIQDITRQVCQALDHASGHKVAHASLEPAKIMSGWDGTVKILSYGISTMGDYAVQAAGKPGEILYYMSPEQLNGGALDVRSNLFTLGAILYEMATEQKPFPGDEAEQIRQQIIGTMPAAPIQVNGKVHPALSGLIMKALAKDPAERYQSGRELVLDLEKCKDAPQKKTETKKMPGVEAPKGLMGAPVRKAPPAPVAAKAPEAVAAKPAEKPQEAAAPAAMAAAASAGTSAAGKTIVEPAAPQAAPQMTMSTATAEPEVETPQIAVDPAMAESAPATPSTGRSFSDISELPPMKPVFIAPRAPAAPETPAEEVAPPDAVQAAVFKGAGAAEEKPKLQPKEIARKAAAEINKVPPKFFMYAIAGALGLILLAIVWIAFKIHADNADDDAATAPAATAPAPAPAPAPQAAAPVPVTPVPDAATAVDASANAAPPAETAEQPQVEVTPRYSKKHHGKSAPTAPAIVAAQLSVTSTPSGAQVQIDGHADPSWVTPYNVTTLAPGAHTVVISKAGYGTETRTLNLTSAATALLSVQLAALQAAIAITSTPAGANILMDGKDTGKVTPAQISVDKPGNHTFTVRKQGYLDDTSTQNLQTGQVLRYGPALRALGSADDIKYGGKFKKMFGGGDMANMGAIDIKTQPKGAQVAVNNRILDKYSPVEFYLNPGTYVVDVTLSGYQGIHRVVTVDKGGKVVIDESLQPQ